MRAEERRGNRVVLVSARTGAGIAELVAALDEMVPRVDVLIDVLVPFSEGRLVARVHELGDVLDEEHTGEGTRIRANVPQRVAGELAAYVVPALTQRLRREPAGCLRPFGGSGRVERVTIRARDVRIAGEPRPSRRLARDARHQRRGRGHARAVALLDHRGSGVCRRARAGRAGRCDALAIRGWRDPTYRRSWLLLAVAPVAETAWLVSALYPSIWHGRCPRNQPATSVTYSPSRSSSPPCSACRCRTTTAAPGCAQVLTRLRPALAFGA